MEVGLENLEYSIIQHLSSPVHIGFTEFCCLCLHRVYDMYDYREGFIHLPACFICGTTEHISVTYGVGECVLVVTQSKILFHVSPIYTPILCQIEDRCYLCPQKLLSIEKSACCKMYIYSFGLKHHFSTVNN